MGLNDKNQIIQAIYDAGVVGAGGAGFPTYFKLNTNAEIVVANGSECEPLLATDKTLLSTRADLVVDGLKIAMDVTGASRGIIAVKRYYSDMVAKIQSAIEGHDNISICLLDNFYPAGDEFLTVYETTGRVIPEGGLPLDVGVVVSNVVSLAQIAYAVHGKAVTNRLLTVNGEVNSPQVLSVPIGTSYLDVIQLAGGPKIDDGVVLDGGPFMGAIVEDLQKGISKTTSGVLLLPREHFVVQMKNKNISQMSKLSKAACCQCFRCTDLCPRHLLGHDIYPHRTMRTIDYNLAEPTEHVTSAFLCSQCGVCEMIACDSMRLSPKKIYAEYRKKLVASKVTSPHRKKDFDVREVYSGRKVAMGMVLKKMDLSKYPLPGFSDNGKDVTRVRIGLNKHIGKVAIPVCKVGDQVKIGDVIARSETGSGFGSVYHASIGGKITDVDNGNNYIEITKKE